MKQIKPVTMTIFLAVAVICLMVLSVLTLSSAAADLRLAEKYAATLKGEYALEAEGQNWLSELDRELQEEQISPGTIEKTFGKAEERRLSAVVQTEANGSYRVLQWLFLPPETGEQGISNFWKGE